MGPDGTSSLFFHILSYLLFSNSILEEKDSEFYFKVEMLNQYIKFQFKACKEGTKVKILDVSLC